MSIDIIHRIVRFVQLVALLKQIYIFFNVLTNHDFPTMSNSSQTSVANSRLLFLIPSSKVSSWKVSTVSLLLNLSPSHFSQKHINLYVLHRILLVGLISFVDLSLLSGDNIRTATFNALTNPNFCNPLVCFVS